MLEKKVFKTKFAGRDLEVTVGGYCMQSSGACFVKCDDTVVMVNTAMSKAPRDGIDFFPLSVDYEEKMYSVGKIPGGYKKRESRPSDKAILTSRLIDRPIRPLFDKTFRNDVTITATVMSVDEQVPPEVYAMIGSSIALSISNIPFQGPTGAVVVGMIDGKFIANPDLDQRSKSKLHLTVSGTKDAIMMVEAGASEVSEKDMIKAILFAHEEIKKIVDFILKIQEEVGKEKRNPDVPEVNLELQKEVYDYAKPIVFNALNEFDREKRQNNEEIAEKEIKQNFKDKYADEMNQVSDIIYKLKKEYVRSRILNDEIRPDGRKLDQIRNITCEVDLFPRTHGSAVFTRGLTQVMTITTLSTITDSQRLDGLDEEQFKRYMHHYNFPGYSVGEAKPMRSPGRREIGHGALAERSLEPVLPSEEDFPYAIRTVSEVLSSNGSTSQASVCGSTLSLMQAGVPIKAPVAGIAMGLISNDDSSVIKVLTDIQGIEDFYGDMDFKVAGTKKGITAIQMDIKIKGIDKKILTDALEKARVGRLFILDKMAEAIKKPSKNLSQFAPKITSFNINPEKIGDVIGSGGKTITQIIDMTGVKIDIDDNGLALIAGVDQKMVDKAIELIKGIVEPIEKNQEFIGEVVRVVEFGAFVKLTLVKDGMIHISKLKKEKVEKVEDVVNVGDKVKVKVIKKDHQGRIDLRLIEVL